MILKFLKYATLSLALSFSVNANSTFTYEQFQEANNTLKESIHEKLNHNINNNRLVMLNDFETPILSINEHELQELDINNDNVKNIIHQINILKNNLEDEINNKIAPAVQNADFENNDEDNKIQIQILFSKLYTMQEALDGITKLGKFNSNVYRQLVDYELINNLNDNKLSNVEQELGMTKSFGTILQEINNEEELNKKTRIIKQFYSILKEKNYSNLDTLIEKSDQNVLNNINEILDIQEVKDYIILYDLDKADVTIEAFYQNFTYYDTFKIDFSKTLQENKEIFFVIYHKYIEELFKNNIIQNFKEFENTIQDLYRGDGHAVQNMILEKLFDCFKSKMRTVEEKRKQVKDKYENIFKEVWDKQFISQPLNKLLNVDFNLDTIQEEINKAENIDEKNQAIQTNFIETVFGNKFENLSTILTSNNDEDLEKVYNILNSEKVTKYITEDLIKIEINNFAKKFDIKKFYNNNPNNIEIYADYMLFKFDKLNDRQNKFIKELNNNLNITNDSARNIKNLLEYYSNKKLKVIENELNKFLNDPYKYFFDNSLDINK